MFNNHTNIHINAYYDGRGIWRATPPSPIALGTQSMRSILWQFIVSWTIYAHRMRHSGMPHRGVNQHEVLFYKQDILYAQWHLASRITNTITRV